MRDAESILGTLGPKWEYILTGMPVNYSAHCIHTFTFIQMERKCNRDTGRKLGSLETYLNRGEHVKVQTDPVPPV